jgi:hypothetical protein
MKTLFKTLIASSLALVFTTSTALVSQATEIIKPVTAEKKVAFKRILVKGNVELTIVQGKRNGVSYADENSGKVRAIQNGDGLEIVSVDGTPAKVTVYVNDIYRIHAMNNAKVKSQGQIKSQFLQVFLSDNASLDLNSTSEGLYTVIEDQAQLNLSGSTNDHMLVMGRDQKLTMDKFAAAKTQTRYTTASGLALLSK